MKKREKGKLPRTHAAVRGKITPKPKQYFAPKPTPKLEKGERRGK